MALNAARDTRLYPVTSPYYGSKGPDFTRRFWPDFIGGLGGYSPRTSNGIRYVVTTFVRPYNR